MREKLVYYIVVGLVGVPLFLIVVAVFFGPINRYRPITTTDIIVFSALCLEVVFAGFMASLHLAIDSNYSDPLAGAAMRASIFIMFLWVAKPMESAFSPLILIICAFNVILMFRYLKRRRAQSSRIQ